MNIKTNDAIRAAAMEWHIRLRDGGDADWEGFEAWLAQDPSHGAAYNEMEELDAVIAPLLPELTFREAANDGDGEQVAAASNWRRYRWAAAGGGLLAVIAAVLVLTPLQQSGRYEVATRPGESRVVALDGATRVTLNGGTRMTFDRKDPRFAALAGGEALFQVHHDAARPFRLHIGNRIVEDAGTIFNVARDAGELRVEVAEGQVVYNPDADRTLLNPGQAIVAYDDGRRVRVTAIPAQSVGAWRKGQLVYHGEPLSRVAADLSRSTGLRIRIAPEIARRPIYGTIIIEGTGRQQLDQPGSALDVEFEADGEGWIMKPIRDEEP